MAAEVLAIPRRPRVEFDAHEPGPALTAALDEVDMTALRGEDVAAGARAAFRAANHADWQRLSYLREMCRARHGTTERFEEADAAVAAAAFGWSMAMASDQLTLAAGALDRLPDLGEGLWEGWLEARKAAVFVTVLADLDDAQATSVVGSVLPEAPKLPVRQLTTRVTRAAIEIDSLWAARRYAASRQHARVRTSMTPAGTAGLSVQDVSPEMAQDAYLHVQSLARVIRTRLRADGRRVRLGYIASHVLLRLVDGSLLGADDNAVIDAVVRELAEDADTPPENPDAGPDHRGPDDDGSDDGPSGGDPDDDGPDDGPDGGDPDDDGPDDGPDGGGPDDDGPDDEGPGSDSPDEGTGAEGPDDSSPDDPSPGDPSPGEPSPGEPRPDEPLPDDPAPGERLPDDGEDDADTGSSASDDCGAGACGAPSAAAASGSTGVRRVPLLPGVSVRMPLSTLLGHDDRSGELPGLGPVPGHLVAGIARRRVGARYRLLLHDPLGSLEFLLDLGPPPGATSSHLRGQIIELTAETDFFEGLDPTGYPPDRAELLRRATAALDALLAQPESHPAVSTTDRDRRVPGAALAAWVRARDQHCPFSACTRPARDNDLDHTVPWSEHGSTVASNLSPLCRAHHTRRHRTWRLRQPAPGRFVITDPTGTEHHTVSRVVDPLPDPCAPTEEADDRLPLEALVPVVDGADDPADPWRPRRDRDGRITLEARDAAARLAERARRLRGDPPSRYDGDPDF